MLKEIFADREKRIDAQKKLRDDLSHLLAKEGNYNFLTSVFHDLSDFHRKYLLPLKTPLLFKEAYSYAARNRPLPPENDTDSSIRIVEGLFVCTSTPFFVEWTCGFSSIFCFTIDPINKELVIGTKEGVLPIEIAYMGDNIIKQTLISSGDHPFDLTIPPSSKDDLDRAIMNMAFSNYRNLSPIRYVYGSDVNSRIKAARLLEVRCNV